MRPKRSNHSLVDSTDLQLCRVSSVTLPAPLQADIMKHEEWLGLFEQLEEKVLDLKVCRALAALGSSSVAGFAGDAVGLLFWRRCLLNLVTESLQHIDAKRLKWVTIDILRLPADHLLAVAEALFERKWQTAADPFAYVSTVARRIHQRNRDLGSLSTKLGEYCRVNDFQDSEVPDPSSVSATREAEVLYDLHLALRRLRLPDNVVRLAQARYHGIPDSRAARDFGWTAKQLRAARQRFARAKSLLQVELKAYSSEPWMSLDVAAEYSEIPAEVLLRLIRSGKLPALKATDSRDLYYIRREELEWMTLEQASAVIGLTTTFLLKLIRKGQLPAIDLGTSVDRYRVRPRDIVVPEEYWKRGKTQDNDTSENRDEPGCQRAQI
jgi:hypothetical protein